MSQILAFLKTISAAAAWQLGVEEAWEGVHVSGTQDSAYYYSTYNAPDKNPISTDKPKGHDPGRRSEPHRPGHRV